MECDDVMSIWYSCSKVCLSFSVDFVALGRFYSSIGPQGVPWWFGAWHVLKQIRKRIPAQDGPPHQWDNPYNWPCKWATYRVYNPIYSWQVPILQKDPCKNVFLPRLPKTTEISPAFIHQVSSLPAVGICCSKRLVLSARSRCSLTAAYLAWSSLKCASFAKGSSDTKNLIR